MLQLLSKTKISSRQMLQRLWYSVIRDPMPKPGNFNSEKKIHDVWQIEIVTSFFYIHITDHTFLYI